MKLASDSLDELCALLEAEAVRQEAIRMATEAQTEAILRRDTRGIDTETETVRRLLLEALAAEPPRLALLREVCNALDMHGDQCTMTALIEAAGEPWRSRLRATQIRLRCALEGSRSAVRRSRPMLQRALHFTENALVKLLPPAEAPARLYSSEGGQRLKAAPPSRPVLLNQRG